MHLTLQPSARRRSEHRARVQKVRRVLIGACIVGALLLLVVAQ